MTQQQLKSSGGFTLIELALALLVGAVIFVPAMMVMKEATALRNTQDRMQLVMSGLAEHVRIYGRYPCPADPALNNDDAGYGVEDCGLPPVGGVLIGDVPAATLIDAMDCGNRPDDVAAPTAAQIAQAGLFRKNIQRVKDVISGSGRENSKLDKTLCMTMDNMNDKHRQRFTYAVTQTATALASFDINDPAAGAIIVRGPGAAAATTNNQIFVLVSHGPDGKGTRTEDGTLTGPACGAQPGLDNENCNGDNVFRSMQTQYLDGAQHFDDMVDFSLAGMLREEDFWSWDRNNPADTPVEGNISFANPLDPNVDIRLIIDQDPTGTVAADDKLVVNRGNVRVEGDLEADDFVASPKYCYDPPLAPGSGC
ncbi:MAG: type II secretion system protein [Bdellovibrionales bacterium]